VRPVSAIYKRSGEEHTGCMVWKTRGMSFLRDGYVPTEHERAGDQHDTGANVEY
jgi:hypothetical protein